MARPASELTQAIWTLCEQNPDITHAQAQPLLAKQGFEVVSKSEMSDDLKIWREQGKALGIADKGDYIACRLEDDKYVYEKDAFDRLALACGLSHARSQKVLQEIILRTSFAAETNNFNVVKYNWQRRQSDQKPTRSTKPPQAKRTAKKVAPVVVTTSVRPKHGPKSGRKSVQPQTVVASRGEFTPTGALEFVTKNGGMAGVKNRVSKINADVVALEQQITTLRAEQVRLNSAVTTLADFQKAVREAA